MENLEVTLIKCSKCVVGEAITIKPSIMVHAHEFTPNAMKMERVPDQKFVRMSQNSVIGIVEGITEGAVYIWHQNKEGVYECIACTEFVEKDGTIEVVSD